jgi:tetrahydromethanopterin S-methyltransferase subunit A
MNRVQVKDPQADLKGALGSLREAIAAEKCHTCGCFHNLLEALDRAFPPGTGPTELGQTVSAGRKVLSKQQYDCLGCEVCYPPLVINELSKVLGEAMPDLEVCPTGKVEARLGWPPLPGSYRVLRYRAPVAVCTLTSDDLTAVVAQEAGPEVSLVGALYTENLGIERLVQNVLANPYLRFVIVCGQDSQQAVGHFPGQSLVALACGGLDERGRIIGAMGRRPILKNTSPEAVAYFRRTVEVVDLIGQLDIAPIILAAQQCAARNPGPSEPFADIRVAEPIPGYLPPQMTADPAGYFVVYVDGARGILSLEHYRVDGFLDAVIEGRMAAELYTPAIDRGLISRLDHAAYLGRELARAEHSLRTGEPYVQDAAPEACLPLALPGGGCGPVCREAGA